MLKHRIQQFIIFVLALSFLSVVNALPSGFVYLKNIDPSIIQDIRYYSANNFAGHPVTGYDAPTCILTAQAAAALAKLQAQLKAKSLSLKVYDCYRPTMAGQDFIDWSRDLKDQKEKLAYYPNVNKADFFKLGYVAEKSGHSLGSTVDLTIVQLLPNHQIKEFNMGTHFDVMDETSHPLNPNMASLVKNNRFFLRRLMFDAGFDPIETEWWHFTLKNEPYPDTYFNFKVS